MNVVKELSELFDRAWTAGAGRMSDLIDILAMQRGPDDPARRELKSLTTIPIREVMISYDDGDDRSPLTAEQMARRNELIKEILEKHPDDHFVHHYHWAVGAIRRNTGYDLLTETQVEEVKP